MKIVKTVDWQMATYHRSIRAQINFSMFGGVLAIVAGFIAPSEPTFFRLGRSMVILYAGAIAGVWFSKRYGDSSLFDDWRVAKTVFLIWMLFPISASMNAAGVATSMYDPIADDGYKASMTCWWSGIVPQIALGLVCTLAYFEHIKSVQELRSGRAFVVFSWIVQAAIAVLWRTVSNWM